MGGRQLAFREQNPADIGFAAQQPAQAIAANADIVQRLAAITGTLLKLFHLVPALLQRGRIAGDQVCVASLRVLGERTGADQSGQPAAQQSLMHLRHPGRLTDLLQRVTGVGRGEQAILAQAIGHRENRHAIRSRH